MEVGTYTEMGIYSGYHGNLQIMPFCPIAIDMCSHVHPYQYEAGLTKAQTAANLQELKRYSLMELVPYFVGRLQL